jgi:hypothetical protein
MDIVHDKILSIFRQQPSLFQNGCTSSELFRFIIDLFWNAGENTSYDYMLKWFWSTCHSSTVVQDDTDISIALIEASILEQHEIPIAKDLPDWPVKNGPYTFQSRSSSEHIDSFQAAVRF